MNDRGGHSEATEESSSQIKKQMVTDTEQRTNRLLTLLSDDDYERLRPHLSVSKLDYKKVLYEARREIRYVYFRSTASHHSCLKWETVAWKSARLATRGLGIPLVLGDRQAPSTGYVQVPGQALRMDARMFREELKP